MPLPVIRAPPTVVVKLKVADTLDLPAIRSDSLMSKEAPDTCPPMTPDPIPKDGVTSTLVLTTIPVLLPALATPIVKPVSVTVMGEEAATAPVATVKAMELPPDVAALKVTPCAAAEIGLVPETKNPVG